LTAELDIAERQDLLYRMKRIRYVEEEVAKRYTQWKMRCPTHLSIGQEAIAAAVGKALRREDFAVSGHRAHAHYLGKGGNLPAMIAEIYGKATGCSRGRGGSMHLIDLAVSFEGSTAIVANSIPVGVGLALAAKLRKTGQISCIFFGDGAVEEGVFYEAANFAAVKGLPVLFLCENNLYSVYTHLRTRQPPGRKIHEMARALGLESCDGDGNDVESVYSITSDAIDLLRRGSAPQFLEFHTYRHREHCGPNLDDDLGYRSNDEIAHWKSRDPIARYEERLLAEGALTASAREDMQVRIALEVDEAFTFAEASPFPADGEAYKNVYAA
jgi:TPP-dependent pyruvate/acetoin dehydrogenase alpha subunit